MTSGVYNLTLSGGQRQPSRRGGVLGLLGASAVPGHVAYAAFSFDRGLEKLPAKFRTREPWPSTVTSESQH